MDLIKELLAKLIDKFKTSNPIVFAIVAAVLIALKTLIDSGVIPLDPNIAGWVLFVIALFNQTSTKKYLNNDTPKT